MPDRKMFWRIVRRLFAAQRGRLLVILLALGASAALTAALLNLQVDARDRLTKEFRVFGANIIVAPRDAKSSAAPVVTLEESVVEKVRQSLPPHAPHRLPKYAAVRRRVDTGDILEGARTVVCVARRYQRDDSADAGIARRVARYARGHDYHNALRKKLRQLAAFVRSLGTAVNQSADIRRAQPVTRHRSVGGDDPSQVAWTSQFQDLSLVEKFELSPEEYEKRTGPALILFAVLTWLIDAFPE